MNRDRNDGCTADVIWGLFIVFALIGGVITMFTPRKEEKPKPPPPPKLTTEEKGEWLGKKVGEFGKGTVKGVIKGLLPDKKDKKQEDQSSEQK